MVGQIGRVVGGRYRLLAPIGTGASADVFLADDVTLRRRVAVKVLHAALAGDESFLRRFRAEARTVAALRHPNIMGVYDWGEEADGPYVVLEFLGGGSLRDLLDRGHRLSPSQALLVGLDTCRALDYAHRRGLVHRDVKPANLLFDDEGRLCIADFGIARALAEATWTEPSGAVVGTVRYASPEQARGSSVDGKADVYALVLVLVEAVTGSVPFAADTTIATLMARLDGPIPVPSELGPLADVLAEAGALDPADRVAAGELAVALDGAARQLPRPAPLPLSPLETVDLTMEITDPTQLGQVPQKPTTDPALANGHVKDEPDTRVFDALADPTIALELVGPPVAQLRPAAAAPFDDALVAAPPTRQRHWPKVVALLLAVLLVLGGVGYAAIRTFTPTYAVPGITSAELAAGVKLPHRFTVHQHHLRRDGTQRGQLLGQTPAAGAKRPSGASITVDVSDGQTLVAVPSVVGLSKADATARLQAIGLVAALGDTPYSDTVAKDQVMDFSPKGDLEKGATVTLIVSNGVRPIQLSDLSNMSYANAKAILDGLGLPSTQSQVYNDTVPVGNVVSTLPGPGPVAPGTTITVNVSKGPQIVTVPDVTNGMSVAEATAALQAAGLQVGNIYGPSKGTHVLDTQPAAGSRVPHGSSVDLFVGR